MSPGDRQPSPSISDGLFYWIAGMCGFATGVVGAAFHLTVDALLHWPVWLVERLGPVFSGAAGAGVDGLSMTIGLAALGVGLGLGFPRQLRALAGV